MSVKRVGASHQTNATPQEARQARGGQNPITPKEQQHLDPPREAYGERETSQARKHDPYKPLEENRNEERHGRDNRSDGPIPYQQEAGERSWEQRFRDIQQELSHMKEVVKGRAPISMDALVQQTESLFTTGVLHFSLPEKFRMPQIEMFDDTIDPIDHLNTYKNQMELHGYQDPIRCRAFAITLKGPALASLTDSCRLPSHHSQNFPSHSSPTLSEQGRTGNQVISF